jgi:hypothetical protein
MIKVLLILILAYSCAPHRKCINGTVHKNVGALHLSGAVYVEDPDVLIKGKTCHQGKSLLEGVE